jgi:hypothetical protein
MLASKEAELPGSVLKRLQKRSTGKSDSDFVLLFLAAATAQRTMLGHSSPISLKGQCLECVLIWYKKSQKIHRWSVRGKYAGGDKSLKPGRPGVQDNTAAHIPGLMAFGR